MSMLLESIHNPSCICEQGGEEMIFRRQGSDLEILLEDVAPGGSDTAQMGQLILLQ